MSMITTKDGVEIYYKDWGSGQPVVFHHGWPLSADDWDAQMMFFLAHGFRVIAHDRRGHGRSSQTATGNEMDTYAADVAQLAAHLDLRSAIHVGHSTGGGEVARYVARYGGGGRVAKAALIGAVPPIMVKSANNPVGLSKCSMAFARRWRRIARNSSTTSQRARSTASIVRAPRYRRRWSRTGGARA